MPFEAVVWTFVLVVSLIVIGGFALWAIRGEREDMQGNDDRYRQ